MTEQLPFNGVMNLDDNNNVFPPACHKHARNVLFKGNPGNYRAENVPGTTLIPYVLPDGKNQCVGSFYDSLRRRTIWFNYNSLGKHGIYLYANNAVAAITVCGAVDYLNFTTETIHSINILYADEDILYFVDSLKRPTKINLNRAISGGYGAMERSFLDVAVEVPRLPPTAIFANDLTATTNNFRKPLYQFKYRWLFNDKEKSAWSAISEMPMPVDFLNPDLSPTINAQINIGVSTGGANVKKIEIAARQSLDNAYGDFYHVVMLDKAASVIADNSLYTYVFRGNTVGDYVYLPESNLLFDYVPREANTQELLNGNIIVYGGIKEGYNFDEKLNVVLQVDSSVIFPADFAVLPAYNFWSSYKFGLIYYDEKGRTNGVVTSDAFEASTKDYLYFAVPRIRATIKHRPPVWAKSYQWVRTKNLSLGKFLYWIGNETFKDDKYAYIGVQNLFNEDPEKQTILSYDYVPGDRVRFVDFPGRDYVLEDFVTSPEINGVQRTGTFVKIKLPTVDLTFDFDGKFGNYFIELYTPATRADKTLDVYYEFGEAYLIGDAGLPTRYHLGQTNQSPDLTVPATFAFTKGDVYYKSREILTGGYGKFSIEATDATGSFMFMGVNLQSSVTTNESFLFNSTSFVERDSLNPPQNQTEWFIKTQGAAYTFRIKGTIKLSSAVVTGYRAWVEFSDGDIFGGGATQIDLIRDTNLVVGDNTLSFDRSITVPANTRVFLINENSSSQHFHYYTTTITVSNTVTRNKRVFEENFSDTFKSAVNSNGRAVVSDDTGETYNPALIRWSEAYQSGTNINNTNRFYPLNFDEYDRAKGDIRRLKVRASLMHVLQSRGCGSVPIFQQILANADGSKNLIQSDKIVNRIRYYQGEYGMGNEPASLASSAGADYFCDPVRGYQCRLAGDGITPISELYKAQYYMPPRLNSYQNNYTNDVGSRARLLGCYDFVNEDYLTVFQAQNDGAQNLYKGDTLAFSEPGNAYRTFFDYAPESIVSADTALMSWHNGQLYIHNSPVTNTFYGTFYPSVIDRVVNINSNVKKEFTSFGYHSESAWECPVITTELGQLSNIVAGDFDFREGMFTAAFLRDINSIGGLNDGDFLKGVWMEMRLENRLNSFQILFGLYVNYLISQRNF